MGCKHENSNGDCTTNKFECPDMPEMNEDEEMELTETNNDHICDKKTEN